MKVSYFIHQTICIILDYLSSIPVCVQMNNMPWKIVKILSYIALGVQIDKGTFRTLDTGTTHPHLFIKVSLSLSFFLWLFPAPSLHLLLSICRAAWETVWKNKGSIIKGPAVRVARAAAAWQYLDPSRSLKKGQLQPLISHGQIVVRALSVCVWILCGHYRWHYRWHCRCHCRCRQSPVKVDSHRCEFLLVLVDSVCNKFSTLCAKDVWSLVY